MTIGQLITATVN